ncbi:hypothetical protein [Brevibacillus laterosporus]|uniref:hypothetical protein n=1 Tax=Brevibacillus laterosporus TaxID=1465 RepID=UPI000E6CBD0A|nr:hypothetical protein [Brevibacillus laterosporus]AYB38941.1 hypothetical protein D5F52_12030 [Brevibacillus laterosporus]MBM7109591.1 hypothetical protein [Brevibacillus laterosporus]
MPLILDFLNLLMYVPFLKPDEEQITKNIKKIRKCNWYKVLLENDEYRKLIIYNTDVRTVIGRFKTEKLNQQNYQMKCQRKLEAILNKKM